MREKGLVTLKIDSHQHFWISPKPGEYIWMEPQDHVLKHDFMPPDLKPVLARNGIQKTIVVQAAVTEAEAKFLLGLAEQHDFIAGVVVWLDMEAPGFKDRLDYFSRHPKFVGIRPMINMISDLKWVLKKSVRNAFQILVGQNICFDFVIHPRHMPNVLRILDAYPDLRAVIDHAGNPRIQAGEMQPWADRMQCIAAYPNVCCKLSGMITRADVHKWKPYDLKPYIRHILDVFGSQRLMFGSDWPVCLLAGSYEDVVDSIKQNLKDLTPLELDDIFGNTARRFYRL